MVVAALGSRQEGTSVLSSYAGVGFSVTATVVGIAAGSELVTGHNRTFSRFVFLTRFEPLVLIFNESLQIDFGTPKAYSINLSIPTLWFKYGNPQQWE